MTLRMRLLLSFVLVAAVTALSVVIIGGQTSASEVRSFMLRGSMVGVDELANSLEAYYQENGSWEGAQSLLRSSGGHGAGNGGGMMGNQRLRVADSSGAVALDSRGSAEGSLTQAEKGDSVRLQDKDGRLIGYLSVDGGSGSTSSLLIQRLTRASLLAAAVGGGVAVLLALLLSFQLLRPVGQLTRAAARMAGGDLSQRVEVKGKDELATLGRSFNVMAESLQQAEQNRQAMTADIAHELRTPIAVQRAHLEALQDGVYPLTAENLQPVLDQTEMLIRLVDDLRTLALADAGELPLEKRPMDLGELTRLVVERFKPEAEGKGIALSYAGPQEAIEKEVDPRRIEQILNNLFSNALRHTPAGGQVGAQVERSAGRIVIRVADNGAGIPPEALGHIFERFYRADRSRSREEGGSGLGLAIARQLALAHGGDLRARNRPEGGAEFTLEL
ncbi:MAG: HAMP domain-containing protein [Anaerolineaceae bacterium]|nr:HAMP domain-containing protein [Anaerolineaceae bacterium]